jgi:hypothetical protein
MRLKILTTSIVSGWALLMLIHVGSAQTAPIDTSRGLSIRYADGRTFTIVLKPKGRWMTAVFPRIDGAETDLENLSLTGLDVSHIVESGEVVVTVSLLYGSGPQQKTVKVTTVRLVAGREAEVDEMRRYGVEPFVLSIGSLPSAYAFAPRGISASPDLDIRATPIGPNATAYRVTVTNHALVPLMWFRFEAHRSEGPPTSALPRDKRDRPLVMPNEEYTFELAMGSVSHSYGDAAAPWQPLDRIEVTALMWQDGVVEGDMETARRTHAFDTQRSQHLRALLRILRGSSSIAVLRASISRTQPSDLEMRQVRNDLIEQLDRFAGQNVSFNNLEFQTWLSQTVTDQEQWLARIVLPKL